MTAGWVLHQTNATKRRPGLVVPAAGVATSLVFAVQPVPVGPGSISPAVQVNVVDAFGSLVASSTASITLALSTNPSGGTLTGSLTLSASGGIATFGDLVVDTPGVGYTLAATSIGLATGISATFTITSIPLATSLLYPNLARDLFLPSAPLYVPRILSIPQLSGVPTPGATLILDTRAGGAQDITGLNTLASAQATTGVVGTNGANSYPVDWATAFENNGSGRAWILPWKHAGGSLEVDMHLFKAGVDFGGIYCEQYKAWFGRTTNGGGVGTVSFYDPNGSANGHKLGVLFRRNEAGGSSTNDCRITQYWEGSRGVKFSFEQYVEAAGTSSGSNDATHLNDTSKSFTVNQWAGGSYSVHLWKGTGNAGTLYGITGNTATQLTTSASMPATDATTQYRIIGPEYGLRQDNTGEVGWNLGGMSGGISPLIDMNSFLNQVVTITWKITPESAPGSRDGRFEQWWNTTKVFDVSGALTGASPLRWSETQIGGPTWTAGGPSADCTEYLWDLVLWNPAS